LLTGWAARWADLPLVLGAARSDEQSAAMARSGEASAGPRSGCPGLCLVYRRFRYPRLEKGQGLTQRADIVTGTLASGAAARKVSFWQIPLKEVGSSSLYWRARTGFGGFYAGLKVGIGISLAIFRRFWAVAARMNSSRAPFEPRKRKRSSLRMCFQSWQLDGLNHMSLCVATAAFSTKSAGNGSVGPVLPCPLIGVDPKEWTGRQTDATDPRRT
jgi:hypothetical protein